MDKTTIIIIVVAAIIVIIALIIGIIIFERRRRTSVSPSTEIPKFIPTNKWNCYDEIYTALNVNPDGNIQCLSTDGINCSWVNNSKACTDGANIINEYANTPNIKNQLDPVICTPGQYTSTNHWCHRAMPFFSKAT